MATLNNGINGSFSGKVGSVVGYQLNGKWVIRALPKFSSKNKKGSPEQRACRSGFTKMQYFLNPLVDFIRVGFNLESKKRMMTAHNVAKSYNMLNAQDANGEINYSKVLLSYGNLLGAENPKVEKDEVGLNFSWTNNGTNDWLRQNDQVMLMAYDVKNKITYYRLSGARRKVEFETIKVKAVDHGSEFHTWISFIADDRQSIAMSTYIGSIIF